MSWRGQEALVLTEHYRPDEAAVSGRIVTEMAEDMATAGWSVDGAYVRRGSHEGGDRCCSEMNRLHPLWGG